MGTTTLLGAAGAIGKSIGDALRSQGTPYRVVGRNEANLYAAFGRDPAAKIVAWDPDDPASARAALRGTRTLIYLIGVPYDQFRLHPVVMGQTLEAAIAEGVERLLLIGTVYPYGRPQTTPVTESHPREPNTFKGRMRKAQEDMLMAAHVSGGIQGAVLRLPDFYGPGVDKSYLDGLIQAAANGGVANMLGPLDTPHEFVYVPDVGPVVTALTASEKAWGSYWHLGGAGAPTQRELASTAFRIAGRKPRIRVAGKTMLRLLGLFNPLMRELVEMNYLLTTPVILDDSKLRDLLASIHKTPYEEGLRRSIEAARKLQ